jgi:hypothetical protein
MVHHARPRIKGEAGGRPRPDAQTLFERAALYVYMTSAAS